MTSERSTDDPQGRPEAPPTGKKADPKKDKARAVGTHSAAAAAGAGAAVAGQAMADETAEVPEGTGEELLNESERSAASVPGGDPAALDAPSASAPRGGTAAPPASSAPAPQPAGNTVQQITESTVVTGGVIYGGDEHHEHHYEEEPPYQPPPDEYPPEGEEYPPEDEGDYPPDDAPLPDPRPPFELPPHLQDIIDRLPPDLLDDLVGRIQIPGEEGGDGGIPPELQDVLENIRGQMPTGYPGNVQDIWDELQGLQPPPGPPDAPEDDGRMHHWGPGSGIVPPASGETADLGTADPDDMNQMARAARDAAGPVQLDTADPDDLGPMAKAAREAAAPVEEGEGDPLGHLPGSLPTDAYDGIRHVGGTDDADPGQEDEPEDPVDMD